MAVALRFNPAPGWPVPPEGYVPPPGWQPDPAWPPAPDGWQLWQDDGLPPVQQPPLQQPWPGTPAAFPAGGVSGRAVTSLVLGILGFTAVTACAGIVFGIVALRNIRNRNLRGRGLAIAGIVLSSLWLAAAVALVGLGVTVGSNSSAQSPAPSAVRGGHSVSVFSLVAGDCFDNPANAQAASVTDVEQTACTVAHNAQIYATFKLTGSMLSYPGTKKTEALAQNGCQARTASLDKSKVTNAMGIRFLFPVQASWLAGRRTVSCMVVNPTPSLTSSLLKGAG
jgi:hypothetical protein